MQLLHEETKTMIINNRHNLEEIIDMDFKPKITMPHNCSALVSVTFLDIHCSCHYADD